MQFKIPVDSKTLNSIKPYMYHKFSYIFIYDQVCKLGTIIAHNKIKQS